MSIREWLLPIPGLIFPLVLWNLVFSGHSIPLSSSALGVWWAEGTKCISVISRVLQLHVDPLPWPWFSLPCFSARVVHPEEQLKSKPRFVCSSHPPKSKENWVIFVSVSYTPQWTTQVQCPDANRCWVRIISGFLLQPFNFFLRKKRVNTFQKSLQLISASSYCSPHFSESQQIIPMWSSSLPRWRSCPLPSQFLSTEPNKAPAWQDD